MGINKWKVQQRSRKYYRQLQWKSCLNLYQLWQTDRHHPEPGNLGFYYFAVPKSVKDHLQGRRRYHCGQLRHHFVFGRQREIHPERNLGAAGQGDHRQLQSIREPGIAIFYNIFLDFGRASALINHIGSRIFQNIKFTPQWSINSATAFFCSSVVTFVYWGSIRSHL